MDDRGLSTVVSYALALGVVALLTSTLFVSMAGLVENQREDTVRSTLEVVGNALVADLHAADRLADERTGTVALRSDLPDRIAGTQYAIEVNESGSGDVTLETHDPEVTVTVPYRTDLTVREATVTGGTLVIEYDSDEAVLEVRDD